MHADTFEHFNQGCLHTGVKTVNLNAVSWKEHKDFPGVFLKAALTEEDTGSPLSCFLVRIEPGSPVCIGIRQAWNCMRFSRATGSAF